MAYKTLYGEAQSKSIPISTRWIKKRVIELSHITQIREMWSGLMNDGDIRGFYLEGPAGPPVPLSDNESLIVLSRSMCTGHQGDYWRRFVYTKELMHAFDSDEEKASDESSFDIQVERLSDPKRDSSPQFRAEVKALWLALGVLCPEDQRLKFKSSLAAGEISVDVISASIRIPPLYVRALMRDDFLSILKKIM